MNYLGEQLDALNEYSKEGICWLSIKIKGRYNNRKNPSGYKCDDLDCEICVSSNKRSGLDQDFCNLFSLDEIKELIISKPGRLIELCDEKSSLYIGLGKSLNDFNNQASKLFVVSGYTDWFIKKKKNYELAKALDRHTCIYCNREYIFVYKRRNREKGKGMVPQFDHWFPKQDYPLLALSFYNLIPSCATCNTIKSVEELNLNDHLHPYIDVDISSTYSFSYSSLSATKNEIIFKNNSLYNSKSIDTLNKLNLELIYEGHSNKELQDLIDLRYKYSTNYLNKLLEETFPYLQISKEERYRLIFGIEINKDNYHKRIFSKFKSDIINELLSVK